MDDEALAIAAARGSRDAFAELVTRYGSRVLAVIEKQTFDHHTALDLAQDVWVRVFRALQGFRPDGRFRPWLFSITLNLVRDAGRSRRSGDLVSTEESLRLSSASDQYDPAGRIEEQAAIEEALQGVSEPFRSALHLIDVVGLTYKEASLALDCSEGTVKSRVNRGRFAFRDLYLKLSGEARQPCPGGPGCPGESS